MTYPVRMLAIDLESAAPEVHQALTLSRSELDHLVATSSAELAEPELVVVSLPERLEIYTTDACARSVFRSVLKELVARVGGAAAVGDARSIEATGVAVAEHLFELAVGCGESSALAVLAELDLAVARSEAAGALGTELGELFACAIATGRRVRRETAVGDVTTSLSERDVAALEVERILEEELVAWQVAHRRAPTTAPAPRRQSSYDISVEPGSAIRLKLTALKSARVA